MLPDENLIELLALACHHDGRKLDLTGIDTVRELEFWPWLRDGGAPDAVATLGSNSTPRRVKIVIEVKHGSGKSGGDEDQLAKYYNAAARQYKNHDVFLVYLTHHRDMPIGDLESSLSCLAGGAVIYWLNWFAVAKWSGEKLHRSQASTIESRILSTINTYLILKGYQRFDQLNAAPWESTGETIYARKYIEKGAPLRLCCDPAYRRTYVKQLNLHAIPCLYTRGGISNELC
ncbi:hypothetical protein [uncultured Thiodictyon sp.]|uniref:hypothetical protein n=1 Tax=uncultured Thiodictyon sp. TaxID=1846217 RepID=UPI0025DA037D|nr:hypothetical protein [uncultured Thiodictyon sp.]